MPPSEPSGSGPPSPAGFEWRDHTADIALHVWAPSLAELFRVAAEGLYATIGQLKCGPATRATTVELSAGDVPDLLQSWLAELLFRFETGDEVLVDVAIDELTETKLHATAKSAPLDRDASTLDREVKAVTYHGLDVTRTPDGVVTTVILDI